MSPANVCAYLGRAARGASSGVAVLFSEDAFPGAMPSTSFGDFVGPLSNPMAEGCAGGGTQTYVLDRFSCDGATDLNGNAAAWVTDAEGNEWCGFVVDLPH